MNTPTEHDFWKGGYDDGLSDAENIVARLINENPEAIIGELRKLRGWVPCNACNGTGKNAQPTHRDLLFALMQTAGAVVISSPLRCRTCYGEALVQPIAEAAQ